MQKFDAKKAVSLIGTALMVVSLILIARRLAEIETDISALASPRVFIPLLMVAVLEGAVIILGAVNYRGILSDISGISVKLPFLTKIYTAANLYKYIPGGIMYIVGRNRLAVEIKELSHAKVALATLAEGVISITAGLCIAVAFRRAYALPVWAVLPVLAVGAAVYICWRRGFPLEKLPKRFALSFFIVTLRGASFMFVLAILGYSANITAAGLYIVAWLAGYLTPGAPGGMGIREVALLTFLGTAYNEGVILSAIVTHRILQILGDLIALGISSSLQSAGDRTG